MTVQKITNFAIFLLLLAGPISFAQNDMAGSQDHPKIPRIQGTNIIGYAYGEYDEAEFITAFQDREFSKEVVGGKRTRLVYSAPGTMPIPQIRKNYGTALESLGEIVNVYNCNASTCASNMGQAYIWSQANRVPVTFGSSQFMYATFGYENQSYWYVTVTSPEARYHIAIYTAYLTGIQASAVKGIRAIHLDIVEEADFKPTLQVVTAEDISKGIAEKGRIALYGIYFDFDSDTLKSESTSALDSVATALRNDPSLTIYVVGHTDDQGEYAYNLELSTRRASAVVNALTGDYAISQDRVVPIGVGPVAPVSSNRTEEGMALNRRVELVEQ